MGRYGEYANEFVEVYPCLKFVILIQMSVICVIAHANKISLPEIVSSHYR